MKHLLLAAAAVELLAGLALLCVPSAAAALVLGSPLDTSATLVLGRVAGAALLALGIACWLASYEARSCAARAVVSAMVVYNLGVVVVLGVAGIQKTAVGVLCWPAVALHAAMAAWCVASLLREAPMDIEIARRVR